MKTRVLKTTPDGVSRAVEVLKRGSLIAFPTDTVYALGCDPRKESAVSRLFEAKRRAAKAVPLLCQDQKVAERLVVMGKQAKRLASLHWPGPLTIVAPLKVSLPELLHQGSGLLGVRVPDDPTSVALATALSGAITGTSANISGKPSCKTAGDILKTMEGRVDVILDGGSRDGPESTVVKVVDDNVEVLREGPIRI